MRAHEGESPAAEASPTSPNAEAHETESSAPESKEQSEEGWLGWAKGALSAEPFWFGLMALALAWRGQVILTPGGSSALSPDFDAAKRWYIVAIGVLLFGWWNSYTNHSLLAHGRDAGWRVRERLAERTNAIRVGVVALAILLNAIGIVILYGDWYSFIGGWLWAISMLVLVLAFVGERVTSDPPDDGLTSGETPWRLPRVAEIGVVVAILILAFVMRVWRLGDLEPGMHGDEGEAGTIGLQILDGVPISPFARGWFTHSNIYFWSVALCMKIFGTGLVGLRSWAVICGLVTVVFTYLVARDLFGVRAAMLAGFFLAFQSADALMSRQLSSNAATPAFTAMAFFFLVRGLRTKRHIHFALAGLAAGFNVYYFAGGRLVAPTIAAFFLYLAVVHRAFLRVYWTRVVAFAIAVGAAVTPFLAYNRAYPLPANAYPNDRFIWLHHADLGALYGTSGWLTIVWDQLQRTLSVLTWAPDISANHILDYPIARPLEAVLIVLGVAWAAWRWRDSRYTLLSLWFWSSVLVGGVLTTDAPNVPRMVGMLPALSLLIAAWLDHFGGQMRIAMSRLSGAWARLAAPTVSGAAIGGIVLISGVQNWDKYINYYLHTHTQPDVTEQAIYVQHQGPRYRYYDMGAPDIYFWHGDNRFINHDIAGVDALNLPNMLPLIDNGGKDADFMVWGDQYDYLRVLHAFYPGGRQESHPFGDPVQQYQPLITYIVTHRQIDRFHVVRATFAPARGRPVGRTVTTFGSSPPPGLTYPVRATWQGGVVAPTYGSYELALSAPSGSRLTVDGRIVPGSGGSLILPQGVHQVHLTARLRNPGQSVRLLWSPSGGTPEPIGRRYLWSGWAGHSWLGEIREAGSSGVTTRRIVGFLGFRATQVGFETFAPFTARWRSVLHVRRAGSYGFEIRSNGGSDLRVDGKRVISNPGDGDTHTASGTVRLGPGAHRLEVTYSWNVGVGYLETWWTPPGGQRQLLISPDLHAPSS